MTEQIDLNADMGEGIGDDGALLEIVSSASIACGGHAGDAATMHAVLSQCRDLGISAGAHPGYADRENFGRKRLDVARPKLLEQVKVQLEAILEIAKSFGYGLRYVKLHGALANVAAEDDDLAFDLFSMVRDIDPALAILALDQSAQVRAAERLGLDVTLEAYADRAYTREGLLVPRSVSGAVIHDEAVVVERCLRLAETGEIVAIDGTIVRSRARSICLHGDTPGAVRLARRVRAALEARGIAIRGSK
ncbi:MAG: LamB/YcsF family protein [Devosia sp.]|uniref:LamB/YcsF family protein n=1 Tax=Devosia sp. TaxID=1871048 RepID=UPI0024CDA6CB|nr:5-oxoprolinase subunit PxpA [Devosia sp.]UYO00129.1 MAG: LamB/YcsF family protein [Devosia sp.]